MPAPRHILVTRFSALGDIAMTVPVIRLLLEQYPELEVTVVSVPFVRPLFDGIDRLHFYPVDKTKYKGVQGLYRLSRELKKNIPFDAIADLHNVLRTKLIRSFLPAVPKAVIDKGRKEKKELTRAVNKKLRPLKSGFERYADVFAGLGFPVILDSKRSFKLPTVKAPGDFIIEPGKRLIGIAPFAKHEAKMYPLDRMKKVVAAINQRSNYQVVLVGGKEDAPVLNEWADTFSNTISIAGKYSLSEELGIIRQFDVAITMDSANMHLASLFGVPVISIWGGTHPYLGFYGWGQSMDNAIQDEHPLRPSSVFGNKPCPGCMDKISTDRIMYQLDHILAQKKDLP